MPSGRPHPSLLDMPVFQETQPVPVPMGKTCSGCQCSMGELQFNELLCEACSGHLGREGMYEEDSVNVVHVYPALDEEPPSIESLWEDDSPPASASSSFSESSVSMKSRVAPGTAQTSQPKTLAKPQPITCNTKVHPTSIIPSKRMLSVSSSHRQAPHPRTDISHLRVRSTACHQYGLYAGASWSGTQTSGRSCYEVNVTIVDVDLPGSFVCGYLQIKGLTPEFPDLTTYFDAEVIGSRNGFLTNKWGAAELEDLTHWSRFPGFKSLKGELQQPHWTIPDKDRPYLFMRWKERFCIPDRPIIGASFDGFYYICIEFNPQPPAPCPLEREDDAQLDFASNVAVPRTRSKESRRDSSTARRSPPGGRSVQPALMTGFYFHQNSEPYQHVSLTHNQKQTTSSFEFR